MTTALSEPYPSVHPQEQNRRLRYLLRYWRYAEARCLLLQNLARRLRYRLGLHTTSAQARVPEPDPAPWLRPGDLALDASGDELARLESILGRQTEKPLPAIAYRSDIRLTARYGYHPVETVWLLEQAGYRVWLLTTAGPVARPEEWFAAQPVGASAPWLLALPPGRDPGEATT